MVAGVAVLVALPALIGALPASDAATSAVDLRVQALASTDVAFTGDAESAGGLALPVSDQLTSAADLLSDRTTMRAWYRGAEDWRVDVLDGTGETDVHRDSGGTWTWSYADETATRTSTTALSLPGAADLLPSALGRRLLSEATDAELSRTGAARIAGRNALGVAITPAAAASSVERVDVWIDADSGVPLRVEVFGGVANGATEPGNAALDTGFLSFATTRPDAATTAFTAPVGATVRTGDAAAELLQVIDAGTGSLPLPATLAGLDRRTVDGAPSQIGIYGSGVTELAVAVVPGRVSGALRTTLRQATGAITDDLGVRASSGPLGLMIVGGQRGGLLLAGTVSSDALREAAGEVIDQLRGGRG